MKIKLGISAAGTDTQHHIISECCPSLWL